MKITSAQRASAGIPEIPNTIFIAGTFISITAILAGAWLFFGNNWFALGIVAAGLLVVGLMVFGYFMFLKWVQKRKANPLSQGIAGNAAAAPQGISEPARRARLDDLRRNFEQGVEKFRAAGKNLYSVPWLVLVGEPGSGKTEAIRHCNVGFPPGLQDQLQGAGGTLNMNWWFTNQAIILDTAGRLMFEEVVPGSTNEWNEFLKLLKNNRPNCPINGMLLVIPVDTLIKDSADSIEKKAGKIAQQFDQIQRILGVRFPVFVIITKCDLLNGFREFFDDLNDPQLQHQMMGWSNPASLDERFDPATVMNHLETVKTRLVERRKNLLLDPVNTEDQASRRVDQVDALYALPDSITKIGPRLRRYLEMIFVAGEWSPKPLFLRGIYFTSSMTEGSALDAELAEVLGVPVDSLPEGRVWRRDRAYFLRDLFVEKVFREKGLVTRATNADKQQRTRRMVVMIVGFLAIFMLLGLTWFGSMQLKKSIGGHKEFWETAAKFDPATLSIVDQNKYNTSEITVGKDRVTPGQLFADNLPLVQSRINIPIIFRPMTFISKNVDTRRPEAYRALYEAAVLRPVYDASRKKIPNSTDNWSPEATAALAELMKLEYVKATSAYAPGKYPQVDLEAMFKFVLPAEEFAKFQKERDGLQKVADWAYTKEAGGEKAWPPAQLAPGTPVSIDPIRQGIEAVIAYWKKQTGNASPALTNINEVRAALEEFDKADKALLVLKSQPIDNIKNYNGFRDEWTTQLKNLKTASERAQKAWAAAAGSQAEKATMADLYTEEMNRKTSDAKKAFELLLQCTVEPPANAETPQNESFKSLLLARTSLTEASKQLEGWQNTQKDVLATLKTLDSLYLTQLKGLSGMKARYLVATGLYELADKRFVKEGDPSTQVAGKLDDAFQATDKEYAEDVSAAAGVEISLAATDPMKQSVALAKFAIETSGRAKKYLIADNALKVMPEDPAKWPDAIAEKAKGAGPESLARPPVALVNFTEKTFSAKFSPVAAGQVMESLSAIGAVTSGQDAPVKIMDARALATRTANLDRGFGAYRATYVAYWRDTVKTELVFGQQKFADLANELTNVSTATIVGQLNKYRDQMIAALDRVGAKEEALAVRTPPPFEEEDARRMMRKWIDLGNDPRQVRRAVLAMPAIDFREGYTVMGAANNNTLAGKYWQALPVAMLRTLAADGRADIEAGLQELTKYEKFPLAPATADAKDELTLQEVLAARVALEKVSGAAGAGTATAAAGVAANARPINQGGVTNNQEVDAQLEVLRGTNLLQGRQAYFDQLAKMLGALPIENNKALTVDVTVNKDKFVGAANPVIARYVYMDMIQKDATAKDKVLRQATLNAAVVDKATYDFPAGEISYGFRETPGGAVLQTLAMPGKWGVLRLLAQAKTVTRDGPSKLTVEIMVPGQGGQPAVSLFLTLEFKTAIPEPKDWPKKP